MRRIELLSLVVVCGGFVGCSGELILPSQATPCTGNCACQTVADCGEHYDCVNNTCVLTTCTPFATTGLCPAGRECSQGVCVPSGQASFCDCDPEEACSNGSCFTINDENRCSETRLAGLCPINSVCIAGTCQEITETSACSPSVPAGLCQTGATCVDGYCLPTTEYACGGTRLDGWCAAGMACVTPGVCDYLECSVEVPFGRCDPGQFCSSATRCIALGSCDGNSDCDEHYNCDGATCIRDLACDNDDDCLSSEHCVSGGLCMTLGACALTADCNADQVCSALGHCIAAGSCESGDDCTTPERCGSNYTCMAPGECAATVDCAPGHTCQTGACVETGQACTANSANPNQTCIDAETCCPEGQRCSLAEGVCIYDRQCLSNADCLATGMVCGSDYLCQFTEPCAGSGCDAATEICSFGGGCIPKDNCGVDGDCTSQGKVCSAMWTCEVSAGCGGDTPFQTTLIKPNMLIVLDRSNSMIDNEISIDSDPSNDGEPGNLVTRWVAAQRALDTVIDNNLDKIRFGLTMFPGNGGTNTCVPGGVSPVANATTYRPVTEVPAEIAAIKTLYLNAGNSSGTPAGPTLRNIAAASRSDVFGTDYATRNNYLLFVTDGEPNCDPTGYSTTETVLKRVRGAINALANLTPTIRSYVIGVDFESVNLDCFAVYGDTPTAGCTLSVPAGTPCTVSSVGPECIACTGTSNGCYYPAAYLSELNEQFENIAGQVASCVFSLDNAPPDIDVSRIRAYLQYGSADPTLVAQDSANGWSYVTTATGKQVIYNGTSCTAITSGGAQPSIVYACPTGG